MTKDHVWHTLQTAIDLMYKGTEEDNKMNYREALKLYEQAVEYFIHAIEYDVLDVKRKESIREKVHKFLNNKGKRAEAYNSYCEITLQLHKPGSNPTNILWKDNTDPESEKFECAEEALVDFVRDISSPCPDIVRHEFIQALAMQCETEETEEELFNPEIEDLLPPPLDDAEEEAEEDLIEGLCGPAPPVIDHGEMEEQIRAEEEAMADIQNLNLEMTRDHDWSTDRRDLGLTNDDIKQAADWIQDMKKITTIEGENSLAAIDINSLNREQRWVYRTAVEAMKNPDQQKLMDVCGGAGTGKSYTINAILQWAKENGCRVQVIAPTGAAASQFVGGKTIHNFLKLTVSKKKKKEKEHEDFQELGPDQAQTLERDLKDVRLIIIDEKSMMGKNRLEQIDSRLKQARPQHKDKPFGGISLLIGGDFKQLPPVFDTPLYHREGGTTAAESLGGVLYSLFDENTFILKAQMRQAGAGNETFKDELTALGEARFKDSHYYRWQRFMDLETMSDDRRNEFDEKATKLAAIKKDLGGWNERGILNLEKPIACSMAKHNFPEAKTAKSDDAGGLYNQLFFAKGCKVVLSSNLWCEAGLVNGSQGTVEYIIYKEGSNPLAEDVMPDLLLVKFPGYQGPSYLEEVPNIVPIVPLERDWMVKDRGSGSKRLTRRQFPLIYGYAITIHKAQG